MGYKKKKKNNIKIRLSLRHYIVLFTVSENVLKWIVVTFVKPKTTAPPIVMGKNTLNGKIS